MPLPTEAVPIERRSARSAVYERIRAWIEDGTLAPGEVIKDAEIALALGVSRTPVREALQMLEHHGVVETKPGRETRVTDTVPGDVALVFAPLSALQALAAEIGTPRATAADVEEMRAHNERLRAAVDAGDALGARESDRRFHGVLVRLSANPYLATALEPMLLHVRRLESLYFAERQPGHESYAEHRQIIDAVTEGDYPLAREITRRNFQRYWRPGEGRRAR